MSGRSAGWASRRGRSLAVITIIIGGALALISSTQVWATTDVEGIVLESTGADALALLQPVALAGLALSLALALTGKVARLVLAAVAVVLGGALIWFVAPVAFDAPVSAVESVVTEHTGIAGAEGVSALITGVTMTLWPYASLVAGLLIVAGGVLALATGAWWRRGGRRYEQRSPGAARTAGGPLDAVDSWDDLTRGEDPTGGS